VQRVLEDKVDACAQRIAQMRGLLADLTAEIGELAGMVAVMRESVSDNELHTLLDLHQKEILRLLAGNRPADTVPSTFPFRLDPSKREVRIGRRRVSLTPREFQVVEMLWEQMPLAVSREAMLERLYGTRQGRSERVVDVHVYNVRQKLRIAGATDATIHSKTGEGWYLDLRIPDEWKDAHPVLGQRNGAADAGIDD
jgi:DNA-binding response OmpR family regulator